MTRALQSLFVLLAAATDRQLAKYVEYLKAENRVLRDRLPKRIILTPRERNRLVKAGRPLGAAIRDLITIVSPRTFLRWANGARTAKRGTRKPGRPRTPESIRELVLQIASETGWGYTRILGELKKLSIQSVSRSTVVGILKEAGLDPGPRRGEGSWSDFLFRHAATILACDFLTKRLSSDLVPKWAPFRRRSPWRLPTAEQLHSMRPNSICQVSGGRSDAPQVAVSVVVSSAV